MKTFLFAATNYIDRPIGGTLSFLKEYIQNTNNCIIAIGLSDTSITNSIEDRFFRGKEYKFFSIGKISKGILKSLNAKMFFRLFVNLVKLFKLKPHIYYFHRIELMFPFIFSSVPKVVHLHGVAEKAITHSKFIYLRRKPFTTLYFYLVKICLKKADLIIAVNEESRRFYQANLPSIADKLVIIPPVVNTESFIKQNLKEYFSGYKVFLFVGRLAYAKGLDLLLKGFAEIVKLDKKFILVLVGDGELRSELESLAIKLDIFNNVKFLGMVNDQQELKSIFFSSDVFVMTSIAEGLSIAALEAVASGLPIVSTDVGDMSKIVKDDYTGYLLKERDHQKLAELMLKAFDNRDSLSSNCLTEAQKYDSKTIVSKIDNLLSKVRENYENRNNVTR